jgi:3-deoxy-manno-octulosonate cytidylyltransferase (CMP-KDO synthetase)
MKKVVGVIPARYASTRFPGKPLALIRGRPMVAWVLEGARKSSLLSKVIVATDDERIAQAVRDVGGEAVMTASDLPSGTDRIHAALTGQEADVVVNIQGDEPLLQPEMLDQLVGPLLTDPSLEMSTLANEIAADELKNPNVVKVITNVRGEAIYFSRFPIPYSRAEAAAPFACLKHVGLYAYQRHFLERFCLTPPAQLELGESLEQLRALNLGARIRVVTTAHRSVGVDTPEDLARIEHWLGAVK